MAPHQLAALLPLLRFASLRSLAGASGLRCAPAVRFRLRCATPGLFVSPCPRPLFFSRSRHSSPAQAPGNAPRLPSLSGAPASPRGMGSSLCDLGRLARAARVATLVAAAAQRRALHHTSLSALDIKCNYNPLPP